MVAPLTVLLNFNVPPLDEFKGKNEVSTVSLPLLFAVTLSIIKSNIYTRLAACNCISITFWSGDLPSPLMAIFYHEILQRNYIQLLGKIVPLIVHL